MSHLQQLATGLALSQLAVQCTTILCTQRLELLLQGVDQEGADGCQGVGHQGATCGGGGGVGGLVVGVNNGVGCMV